MRFLITIARMYPGRSALTLVSLLFASVAEGSACSCYFHRSTC